MGRVIVMQFQNLKIYFIVSLFFTFISSQANAQFGDDTINMSFSPSTIERGQSSRLTWSASFFSNNCQIGGTGVPSIPRTQSSGSITVSPTSNADAFIICDSDFTRFASATLTVTEPANSVTVTTSFSPSSVAVGQSSTFRWSSTGATSCSSNQLSISGTSGSRVVTPGNTNNIPVTVTCTGNGNSGSSSSTLTVTSPLPSVTVIPGFISSNFGVFSAFYTSTNATSCTGFGVNGGTSGTVLTFVSPGDFIAIWSVTCTGPGGTATGFATASVPVFFGADDALPAAELGDVIVTDVDEGASKQSIALDINNDGVEDMIGVDQLTQRLVVLITETEEQAAVSKVVDGVSDISQLSRVSMGVDGDIVVTTTTQQ